MIASKSNVARLATITDIPASLTQDVKVVANGDFSSIYTVPLTTLTINFDWLTPQVIKYIAIGGSNVAIKSTVKVTDNTSSKVIVNEVLNASDSNTMMWIVDVQASQSISIKITGGGSVSIGDISIGDTYTIPNDGEQPGFSRPWSVPNIEARSASSLQNAPIAMTYQTRALSCTLTIPNNIMTSYDEYYAFLKFASKNTFYILEDENKFHSYSCFNAKPDMTKSHSLTNKLGVSSIKFNAHAKLTDGLFT